MAKITAKGRENLLAFWLFISSFGIMFAVLSWMQEGGALPPASEFGVWKGTLAVATGAALYWIVARYIPGGAGDE
jgi:hypothetical protein